MTQRWSPPGHHRYGIICSHCQAVASYTISGCQAGAVQAMGGHLSHTQKFYCPRCALQHCHAEMSEEAADRYMSRCWVCANDLWHHAGMAQPPPTTCSELAKKVKQELVADATSNFAVTVWGLLDPLEQLQFSDPPLPRLKQLRQQPVPHGKQHLQRQPQPPPATGNPANHDNQVADLLEEMHNLDLELGRKTRYSQELARCLRDCQEELRNLLHLQP